MDRTSLLVIEGTPKKTEIQSHFPRIPKRRREKRNKNQNEVSPGAEAELNEDIFPRICEWGKWKCRWGSSGFILKISLGPVSQQKGQQHQKTESSSEYVLSLVLPLTPSYRGNQMFFTKGQRPQNYFGFIFGHFLKLYYYFFAKKVKRCFSTQSPPKPGTFVRGQFLRLEHHTLVFQSKIFTFNKTV